MVLTIVVQFMGYLCNFGQDFEQFLSNLCVRKLCAIQNLERKLEILRAFVVHMFHDLRSFHSSVK